MRHLKSILLVIAALAVAMVMGACGSEESVEAPEDLVPEVAMITEGGEPAEGSFGSAAWQSIETVCADKGLGCSYYTTEGEATDEAYLATVKEAIDAGAKLVVLPGSGFETLAYKAQKEYPETLFLLVNGVPHNEKENYATKSNTVSIVFAEEDAGYLAGYAAVKDGYTDLGYLGGKKTPAVKRYGYGFVQGAKDAADEDNVKLTMYYEYTSSKDGEKEVKDLASTWYKKGAQLIFVSRDDMVGAVAEAAEEGEGKLITTDVDHGSVSEAVISSAQKNLDVSIGELIRQYAADSFTGGKVHNFGVGNDGVFLDMDNSKFTTFDKEMYDDVINSMKDGEIKLKKDKSVKSVETLGGDTIKFR